MPKNPEKRRCTAKSKQSGAQCRRFASPGFKVCHMHGSKGARANLKHGRYSKSPLLNLEFLRGRVNEMLNDPGIKSLRTEVALLRAILVSRLESMDQSGSVSKEEAEEVQRHCELISKVVEKCVRIEEGMKYTIDVRHADRMFRDFADVVKDAIESGCDKSTSERVLFKIATVLREGTTFHLPESELPFNA